jgi:hypothetical protein
VVAEDTMDGSGGVKQRFRRSIRLVSSRTQSGGDCEEETQAPPEILGPPFVVRTAVDTAQSRESWTCSSGRRERQMCHPKTQALELEGELRAV